MGGTRQRPDYGDPDPRDASEQKQRPEDRLPCAFLLEQHQGPGSDPRERAGPTGALVKAVPGEAHSPERLTPETQVLENTRQQRAGCCPLGLATWPCLQGWLGQIP